MATPTTIDACGLETTGAVEDVSLHLCATIMPNPKLKHQFNNNKTVLCDCSKLYQLEIIFRYVIFEARLANADHLLLLILFQTKGPVGKSLREKVHRDHMRFEFKGDTINVYGGANCGFMGCKHAFKEGNTCRYALCYKCCKN